MLPYKNSIPKFFLFLCSLNSTNIGRYVYIECIYIYMYIYICLYILFQIKYVCAEIVSVFTVLNKKN